MPYDEFGNPVNYPTKEEIEQERRWKWFGVGWVIGLIFGIAIAL